MRRLIVICLALVLIVLTAGPASASEHVLTPSNWSHNGTTVYATLGISKDFVGDARAFVKYRKNTGGGTYSITISNLRLYRDGNLVKSRSGGPFGITGSWAYFKTDPIGIAGSCGTLRATATVTLKHTNGDGHTTTRPLSTPTWDC